MPPRSKYPVSSGRDVIKALESIGYEKKSQRGSHVKMVKYYGKEKHIIVVPLHRELDRGTLKSIIRRISRYHPEEDFIKILKQK